MTETWPGGYTDPDEAGGLLERGPLGLRDVAALLVTGDGRYLMQLRDDFPHLRVPGHWALFGGRVEPGETPRQALVRELAEELEFTPARMAWFTETSFVLPQFGVGRTLKSFFEVPISAAQVDGLRQHEGAGRGLFTLPALLAEDKVVPWDLYGVLLHARRAQVFVWPTAEP